MNLRLSDVTARALREAALRSGRSQQELLREAVDRYLGLATEQTELDRAVASGLVRPPTAYRDIRASIRLETGTSLDLLARDER